MATKKVVTMRVAQVLDTSGSMRGESITNVLKVMNGLAETYKKQKNVNVRATFVTFDNTAVVRFEDQHVDEFKTIDKIVCDGWTNIFEAVEKAVASLEKFGKSTDVYLINLYTDGANNQEAYLVKERVAALQKLPENWTVTFMVPPKTGDRFASQYGIPRGNVSEWETSTKGIQEMEVKTTAATTDYLDNVSCGGKGTKDFYNVQTDLSTMKKRDLKKLTDLSATFKSYLVAQEVAIKEFVEAKTKKGYVIGSTFYALTKKEKIQPSKDVMILDNATGKLYGGPEGRDLIGLKPGIVCVVEPVNHAGFTIFVKSTSVNRKLVRGTKVLVDKNKIKNDAETWNSAGAARSASH